MLGPRDSNVRPKTYGTPCILYQIELFQNCKIFFENNRIHISVCCVVLWYNKSVVIQKETPQALKKEGLLSETGLFQNCWKQFLRSPRGQLLALLVTTFAALLFRLLLGSFSTIVKITRSSEVQKKVIFEIMLNETAQKPQYSEQIF